MFANLIRKLFPRLKMSCVAPKSVIENWPRILQDASLSVHIPHSGTIIASHAGKITCGPYDTGTAYIKISNYSNSSWQGSANIVVSGGATAAIVIRVLLCHGCTIHTTYAPLIGHSLFICQLNPMLLDLLRTFDWPVWPDGKEPGLVAAIEPLIAEQLHSYIGKSLFQDRKAYIAIGAVGNGNVYCAFRSGYFTHEQWLLSQTYKDVIRAWTSAGFSEISFIDSSE